MCTVSWVHQSGSYHLLCNRDEKRTRRAALPPRAQELAGVRFLAPLDPDGGGSWIAVNEFGIALCLLNGPPDARPAARSRGLLLPDLISAAGAAHVLRRTGRIDVAAFAPFTLLVVEPGGPACAAVWNGKELRQAASVDAPLISSSFDADGVHQRRLEEFRCRRSAAGQLDPAGLYWFHASHGAAPSPYSPCMHRPDAETVSFTWIVVNNREIRFFYAPVSPCRHSRGDQQLLARAA